MKKTLLAVASALILGGTLSGAALAQSSGYSDRDSGYQDSRYDDDRYDDDRYDDDRYGDDRYGSDGRYDDRRGDERYARQDIDGDGIDDRHDIYDNRNRVSWDRNRDGVNDRYDRGGGYDPVTDRNNRDGDRYREGRFSDRRQAHKRYRAGRYQEPRHYRNGRYSLGSRLPAGYYGTIYYVDYRSYGLSQPPRGYRWNRVGDDVYLVSINNGLIRDVVYSLFY